MSKALFKSRGSIQMRNLSFRFSFTTMEFTQAVGSFTGLIMPFDSMSFNSAKTLSRSAAGSFRGGWTTGFESGLSLM